MIPGTPREFEKLESDLSREREKGIRKISTEIDLFVESLKSKESKSDDKSSSTILNIYSPVGSIQTVGKEGRPLNYKFVNVLESG